PRVASVRLPASPGRDERPVVVHGRLGPGPADDPQHAIALFLAHPVIFAAGRRGGGLRSSSARRRKRDCGTWHAVPDAGCAGLRPIMTTVVDEPAVREAGQAFCGALIAGNVERAMESFSPELRRNPGEVLALLPLPANDAAIESVERNGAGYNA